MTVYAKSLIAALVAVVYAALLAYQAATGDGFQPIDVLPVISTTLGAVLTYAVPNVPQLPWAKTAVQAALGVIAALTQLFADGTSGIGLTAIAVTVLGALAVYQVPNKLDPAGQHALDA